MREPLPLPLGSPIYITASEFYEIANGVMKEIREEEIKFQREFQRSIKAHSK